MGRQWHLFFAWIFVLNGVLFGLYALASRHFWRDLFPKLRDLRGIGRDIMNHLRFRHATGEEARRYNVMQKLAYTGVIFGLGPLIVLTGLTMSPAVDAAKAGVFRTPLGDVSVDAGVAEALRAMSEGLVDVDHDAHRGEHAVEVELPFLQLLRSDVRIVPLVIAWDAWEPARRLGEMLARLVASTDEPALLLASSDLNHYEPAAVSEKKDAAALVAVRRLDGADLLARCKRERISMCGRGPAAVVLAAARALGATHGEVVDYRHSGWVSGDNGRVVGYAGVVIP